MTTKLIAADAVAGAILDPAVGDGTLVIQTGAAGAKVDAVTFAADGTPTFLKPLQGKTLTLGTAQNTTSGTSIDFTGIPSWVKRITISLSGVSTTGTSTPQIQIGAGSIATSGYGSCGSVSSGAAISATANSTTGFILGAGGGASDVRHGSAVLSLIGSNIWAISGALGYSSGPNACFFSGSNTLGGTLDRIRLTTVNGTDTFDAGSVNILYEG